MSGSTIGGFAGGVIGFMVGGPAGAQWGFMIGSAVGGYVDPMQIEGPRLTDAQTQTTMEGAPRPIVFGTATISDNLIQSGPLVEHKDKDRVGKGGGTEQTTYTYTLTFALRVCEGPVTGISRIWADDKLIYDTRNPDDWPGADIASMAADTARTASQITIYPGDEAQLPDAALEALPAENGGGLGNVPAYRGTCYVVFRDWDLTDRRGSVPQFRFEVVGAGTVGTTASYSARKFAYGDFPWKEDAPTVRDPRRSDVTYEYAFWPHGGSEPTTWYPTLDQAIADATAGTLPIIDEAELMGWSTVYYGTGTDGNHPIAPWQDVSTDTWDWRTRYTLGLIYSRYVGDGDASASVVIDSAGGPNMQCSLYLTPQWGASLVGSGSGDEIFGNATVVNASGAPAGNDNDWNCYNDSDYVANGLNVYSGFAIACRPVLACVDVDPDTIATPDASGVYLSLDGEVTTHGTCTVVSGTFKQLQRFARAGVVFSTLPFGPVLDSADPNYSSESYWTAAYAVEQAAGNMDAGLVYGVDYPVTVTSACQCSPLNEIVSANAVILSDIVTALCSRVGITASQLDVSQLTDSVRGFVVGQPMSAADAVRSLQQGYFFDFPEWGDYTDTTTKLRGIKRGGAYNFTITDDDLLESDDDEDARPQAVEFPRKLNLITSDVDADYNPTKQTAERRTENVKAVGEANVQLPLSLTRAEAAPKADIMLKVAWMEAEGRTQFMLPEEFSAMVPSDPFMKDGKRWRAEQIEYGDGTVSVKAVRDRVSAYSSDATSGGAIAPSSPTSGIRGPTLLVAMNLPSLRSADNVPGIYAAVQGLVAGWPGCALMLSVDGGVSEQLVATITQPAVMGELTADCGSSGEPISVKAYYGGAIDSVTADQIAARQNAFAIITGGVAEIGQVQTATEGAEREYDWTGVTRGELGTTAATHFAGDRFVMLDGAVFVPIDIAHAGKTLILRAVTLGTAAAKNGTVSIVFDPPTFIRDGGVVTP